MKEFSIQNLSPEELEIAKYIYIRPNMFKRNILIKVELLKKNLVIYDMDLNLVKDG